MTGSGSLKNVWGHIGRSRLSRPQDEAIPDANPRPSGHAVQAGEPGFHRPVPDWHKFPVLRIPIRGSLEREFDRAQHQGVIDRIGAEAAERPLVRIASSIGMVSGGRGGIWAASAVFVIGSVRGCGVGHGRIGRRHAYRAGAGTGSRRDCPYSPLRV